MSGIVESVLTSWRSMAINPDFQPICSGPSNSEVKKLFSTLDVRRVAVVKRPVTNRDTEGVDPSRSNVLDILFCEPGRPVGL